MPDFNGFYPETIDFFMGIGLNNNQEWYHAHKEAYNQYVKQPITALAEGVYARMQAMDPDFNDKPKVSRINRDTRFSKNKSPYKTSSWFFLREDGSPGIQHEKPCYFFEIMTTGYWYGLSFSPPSAALRSRMRAKMAANPVELERHAVWVAEHPDFTFSGEAYQKMPSLDLPPALMDWAIRKEILICRKLPLDDLLFSPGLLERLYEDYAALYPIYEYFYQL